MTTQDAEREAILREHEALLHAPVRGDDWNHPRAGLLSATIRRLRAITELFVSDEPDLDEAVRGSIESAISFLEAARDRTDQWEQGRQQAVAADDQSVEKEEALSDWENEGGAGIPKN